MDIKRISFIEARSPGAHIFSKFPIPRLGAVLLSTILKESGYEVMAFIEDISDPDWSFVENSDIVCISTITSTSMRAYMIADWAREKGITVIIGGAHPSFLPDEALEHADYVIRGEGDHNLLRLLSYIQKGAPSIDTIAGLSYKDRDGNVKSTNLGPLLDDLDSLPEPDFSLVHNWKPSNIFPVSTSRGCPFNCTFCSVIQMFGRKYRFKSVETALKEFKHVSGMAKRSIFVVDDNFAANKRRTKDILRGMIAEDIKTAWSAQVRTDVARDPELLRLMADSGCDTTHIGFESINPKTLEAYNKKQNREDIINCIRAVKDHGIHIHGMFVLGADTDNVETIKRTSDFAISLGIDTIQFMMLTPLPGTPFFYEMKNDGRLLHTDWSKYDAHHVVFNPALMTPKTLQIETLKAMGRFYSWKYILRHLVKFDFFYAGVGMYGKKAIKRGLRDVKGYIDSLSLDIAGDRPLTTS